MVGMRIICVLSTRNRIPCVCWGVVRKVLAAANRYFYVSLKISNWPIPVGLSYWFLEGNKGMLSPYIPVLSRNKGMLSPHPPYVYSLIPY